MSSINPIDQTFLNEHLPYEVETLSYAYNELLKDPQDQHQRNVLIECFCIHSRNLIEFFNGRKERRDFKATDFAPSFQMPVEQNSTAIYDKLSKQITHFSKDRKADPREKIDGAFMTPLYITLFDCLRVFQQSVKPEYRPYLSLKLGPQGPTPPASLKIGPTGPSKPNQ